MKRKSFNRMRPVVSSLVWTMKTKGVVRFGTPQREIW